MDHAELCRCPLDCHTEHPSLGALWLSEEEFSLETDWSEYHNGCRRFHARLILISHGFLCR